MSDDLTWDSHQFIDLYVLRRICEVFELEERIEALVEDIKSSVKHVESKLEVFLDREAGANAPRVAVDSIQRLNDEVSRLAGEVERLAIEVDSVSEQLGFSEPGPVVQRTVEDWEAVFEAKFPRWSEICRKVIARCMLHHSDREIAGEIFVNRSTVNYYVTKIKAQFCLTKKSEIASFLAHL